MTVKNALAGIAVRNLEKSVVWYQQLLGRQPDTRPMDQLAEWRFEVGGWIQVFEDKGRAGSSSVTLVDTNVAERIADLKAKGITIESEIDAEPIKVAIITDPDGNRIVFAEGKGERHRAVA